jgi:hypothetical protein
MALGGLARSGAAKDDMFQRVLDAFTFDLLAAREQGLETAFVRRTEEWGDLDLFDQVDEPDQVHDVIAEDFHDLVEKIAS